VCEWLRGFTFIDDMELSIGMLRNALLYLAKNPTANALASRYGKRLGASQFVAGETLQDAIAVVRHLNQKGILGILDHLGEFVKSEDEAKQATFANVATIEAIDEAKVQAYLSVKLTQLGLDFDEDLCYRNMEQILTSAQRHKVFVRIDMEDYRHNESTLQLFRTLVEKFDGGVGLVIQAYLRKSEADLDALAPFRPNLRIVKGAYQEPESVAFRSKEQINSNYINLAKKNMQRGHYTALATHDITLINDLRAFVTANQISRSLFEFQMLYGVRTDLQHTLSQEGYAVRVYVPFGHDWYGYFMRRLAERPANVKLVWHSLISH